MYHRAPVESGTPRVLKHAARRSYVRIGQLEVQSKHAVNDLTLKVTAPNGITRYWGNCGLRAGNWSSAECNSGDHPFLSTPGTEVIDTVENVFVQGPAPGTWTVYVIAEGGIAADAHLETPGVNDADFALVVSIDPDCNGNGFSDADDILANPPVAVDGACCLSHTPGDCIISDECECNSDGIWFFGAGTKCGLVNCQTAPQ